ncbi:MAG: 50S ribosomal protein L9 [Spirochaetes bacterium]|jgi:large subunit ribosomal protein L9|nr:50S ribosomal protein L9 [Spirochaetota bacterium]
MKVILNSDVSNLGEEGDVKDVADGYARNFLIPRGMVMPYSRQNLALIESRRATIEKRKEDKREQAKTARERLEGESLTIQMTAGERGKLFGSVTSQTIAEELEKRGIEVERKKIDIEDGTIKTLGTHTVRVRLYADEEAQLKVVVEPDEKSAARQQPAPAADARAEEAPAEEAPAEEAAAGEAATAVAEDEESVPAEADTEAEAGEEAAEEEAAEEEALEGEEDRE